MTDLLTTKQVQTLLHVDRTTIYRMVEGGQLPAVRVGKQWRFARADVERWLQSGRYGALPAAAREESQPKPSVAPADLPERTLAEVLPPNCAQAVQDAFADMLGVTMVITDMQGRPITQISNPCGFFNALMAGNPDGIQHCVHTWQHMAGHVALEPKFTHSEMGLMCARGLIRVGAELKGMVVVGGIAPEGWPPNAQQAAELAHLFDVPPEIVVANADEVFRMDRAGQERALRFVQRMADVFSQMAQDRLASIPQ
jgi:excisionase family DNA binding protein